MSEAIDHVRGLVDLTAKVQRDRMAYFVDRPKRWGEIVQILSDHCTWHFDDRYWIDCEDWSASAILDHLLASGAPPVATIVFQGGSSRWSTPVLPLRQAIDRYHCSDNGVVVSCLPGRLVYFEGHEHDQRGILKR